MMFFRESSNNADLKASRYYKREIKNDDVALVGFGTFSVAERAERIGRNFKTGKNIQIPASKSVKFKAGKALRNSLN